MDDYMREMMDLKTLVSRTLEKKGVLAKIRAELRASVFEAIEDEDRNLENEEGASTALLGSCNERAKQLHATPSGKLLTALVCEYLEWAQLGHTLKVYLPECNLPKGFWKSELKDVFGAKVEPDINSDGENGPLLLEVLETFLRSENISGSASTSSSKKSPIEGASTSILDDSSVNTERQSRRPSTSVSGSIPHGRHGQSSSSTLRNSSYGNVTERASDAVSIRKGNSTVPFAGTSRENGSLTNLRKEDDGWRYQDEEHSDDVAKVTNTLENIQLDRKARNLTSSWRNIGDGVQESDYQLERDNF